MAEHPDDGRVLGDPEPGILEVPVDLYLRTDQLGGFAHGIVHGTAHPLDICLLDRTALACHLAFRGDDVVCAATGYATDVGRTVRAHGTKHTRLAHVLDGTACGLDGADALLGGDAGMARLADEARRKGVVIRSCQAGTAHVASIIEDEARLAGSKFAASKLAAPRQPVSSWTLKMTLTVGYSPPSSTSVRTVSMIAATPTLSSPPKTVVPSL